ncbi:MAG: protein-L-isoaspartate(D-aspartate) O-methyltransferase [bacterium]|nr:protein-L-isoaspartate(D-aspartate) O-methyltransferase [bacterium]
MENSRIRSAAGTVALVALLISVSCRPTPVEDAGGQEPDWQSLRHAMVVEQIQPRGVGEPLVLQAMRTVPRHEFVDPPFKTQAYDDVPLPIGDGQSIPQPYIVALMAELLEVGSGDKVLEVGTGSGYQAAVLAAMGVEVYTIEIRPGLCAKARERLERLGYSAVSVRCEDGYGGWAEAAPFDGIVVTGAWETVPEPLYAQLAEQGRLVIPLGESLYKDLRVVTRTADGFEERSVIPVSFEVLDRDPPEVSEEDD